jgi:hypothetical protein
MPGDELTRKEKGGEHDFTDHEMQINFCGQKDSASDIENGWQSL